MPAGFDDRARATLDLLQKAENAAEEARRQVLREALQTQDQRSGGNTGESR